MKGAIQVTGREHIALAQDADTDATAFLRSAWAHLNNSQQLVNFTESYVYDTAGNLKQMQHAGASTYTRYIDIDTDTNRGLQRPSQGSPDFTNSFDANGNQILMGHVDSLAWDYQDRLQKVVLIPREDDQDDAEWYVYDGSGQRMRKVRETVGYGGTTVTIEEKIYLGDAEIKRIYRKVFDEYDVPTTTKVLDRTSLHVMDDKSRVSLVHHWTLDTDELEVDSTLLNTHRLRFQYGNHLGSASLELDASGDIISYEEYLPYGGTSFVAGTSQTEVSLKEYRYSGKERDNSTGFYYYGARYYAPWVGRWVSTDPLGLKAGINDCCFVHGNPVTRIDVDGRLEKSDGQQPTQEQPPNSGDKQNGQEQTRYWKYVDLMKRGLGINVEMVGGTDWNEENAADLMENLLALDFSDYEKQQMKGLNLVFGTLPNKALEEARKASLDGVTIDNIRLTKGYYDPKTNTVTLDDNTLLDKIRVPVERPNTDPSLPMILRDQYVLKGSALFTTLHEFGHHLDWQDINAEHQYWRGTKSPAENYHRTEFETEYARIRNIPANSTISNEALREKIADDYANYKLRSEAAAFKKVKRLFETKFQRGVK